MRPSDYLIDLNDLWGRLIPGTLILFDLYLWRGPLVAPIALPDNLSSGVLTTGLLFGFLMVAYIIGELSLFPIFRLRRLLNRKRRKPREILKKADVTADDALMKFFEQSFSSAELDDPKGGIFGYCKDSLMRSFPAAYAEARRREARINQKGGVILPLALLLAVAIGQSLWLVAAIAFLLLVVFWLGFAQSSAGEHSFVFRAYYYVHSGEPVEGHKHVLHSDS